MRSLVGFIPFFFALSLTPSPLVGDQAHHNSYSAPSPGSSREGGGEGTIPPSALRAPSPTRGEGTQFWQRVTWTTADGIQMAGLYHPASRSAAYTWILLHGLGSHKDEWKAFGSQLAGQGNGVFLYDARGHGESVHSLSAGTITYQAWKSAGPGSPWDVMPADLSAAVQWLHKKYGIPENKIAIGGASLGANVGLRYAAEHPAVPALLLLSPGIDYAGIQSPAAYKAYAGRPVFIAASPSDSYAYSTVRQLSGLRSDPAQRVVAGAQGHGVNMLDEEFKRQLLDWMKYVESH